MSFFARLGYASLSEYGQRVLDLKPRGAEERVRVGRALATLPALNAKFESGELCWSAARELTRIATAETEQAWTQWAAGKSARQIERAVARRHVGDAPGDPGDPRLVTHRLSFKVKAETLAMFRDLQSMIRAEMGGRVEDDDMLMEIARRALGGPQDEGRASYQVAVTRCDSCGETAIEAGGESYRVDESVAQMAECDAQQLGRVDGGGMTAGHGPHVGAPQPVSDGPHVGAPQPVSDGPHVGVIQRATQTIPPATRRAVMRRHHKRCAVTGCQNHRFVDVHHCDPRAEGGTHDPEQLLVACGAHHRALHRGQLVVTGTASTGFRFHHADRTPYGAAPEPEVAEAAAQAFSALRQLGFKETKARQMLDTALAAVDDPKDIQALVRAALQAS
jgi:hypothetical protein